MKTSGVVLCGKEPSSGVENLAGLDVGQCDQGQEGSPSGYRMRDKATRPGGGGCGAGRELFTQPSVSPACAQDVPHFLFAQPRHGAELTL